VAAGVPQRYGDEAFMTEPTDQQMVNAAFNLAGSAQTGAIPFGPVSRGGTIGAMPIKNGRAVLTEIPDPSVIKKDSVLYHGTKGNREITAERELYLTNDPSEAAVYAQGEIPGATRSVEGKPIVRSFKTDRDMKSMDINELVNHAMDKGIMPDDIITDALGNAQNNGYDFVHFSHPSVNSENDMLVYVPVLPRKLNSMSHNTYNAKNLKIQEIIEALK
jgi:hypothetical protein